MGERGGSEVLGGEAPAATAEGGDAYIDFDEESDEITSSQDEELCEACRGGGDDDSAVAATAPSMEDWTQELHFAARGGSLRRLIRLFARWSLPLSCRDSGIPDALVPARKGVMTRQAIERASLHLRASPSLMALVNVKSQSGGNTALHMASANGHMRVIRFLLSVKASPILNDSGNSPLYWAIQTKQRGAALLLLGQRQSAGAARGEKEVPGGGKHAVLRSGAEKTGGDQKMKPGDAKSEGEMRRKANDDEFAVGSVDASKEGRSQGEKIFFPLEKEMGGGNGRGCPNGKASNGEATTLLSTATAKSSRVAANVEGEIASRPRATCSQGSAHKVEDNQQGGGDVSQEWRDSPGLDVLQRNVFGKSALSAAFETADVDILQSVLEHSSAAALETEDMSNDRGGDLSRDSGSNAAANSESQAQTPAAAPSPPMRAMNSTGNAAPPRRDAAAAEQSSSPNEVVAQGEQFENVFHELQLRVMTQSSPPASSASKSCHARRPEMLDFPEEGSDTAPPLSPRSAAAAAKMVPLRCREIGLQMGGDPLGSGGPTDSTGVHLWASAVVGAQWVADVAAAVSVRRDLSFFRKLCCTNSPSLFLLTRRAEGRDFSFAGCLVCDLKYISCVLCACVLSPSCRP